MKRIIFSLVAAMITLLALANVAAASGVHGYQPEVPSKLLK